MTSVQHGQKDVISCCCGYRQRWTKAPYCWLRVETSGLFEKPRRGIFSEKPYNAVLFTTNFCWLQSTFKRQQYVHGLSLPYTFPVLIRDDVQKCDFSTKSGFVAPQGGTVRKCISTPRKAFGQSKGTIACAVKFAVHWH